MNPHPDAGEARTGVDRRVTLLGRLAVRTVRHRKAVLAVSGALLVVFAALGANVRESLSDGGFEADGAESARTLHHLQERFGAGEGDVLLLVTARSGDVDDPRVADAGRRLTTSFAAEPGVAQAYSYWTLEGAAPLRSSDRTRALVVAELEGDRDAAREALGRLTPRYSRDDAALRVRVTGFAEVSREVSAQSERDLRRAELIAFPVCALLLLLVFRSVVAAALPLLVGGLAVVGALAALAAVASVTQVSVFALNITIGMGLGLAVDYALFVVSRFRQELGAGRTVEEAVVRTVETTGRMVLLSGLTVAASIASLMVFPLVFLRSFGIAGVAVVALATAAATITLPALLAVLGPRVDAIQVRRQPRDMGSDGRWFRWARAVMRRPLMTSAAAVTALLVLGAPALRMELGMPDERVLPPGSPPRQVLEELRGAFPANEGVPLLVAVTEVTDPAARQADLHRYAARVSAMDGVARVDAVTGSYVDGVRLFTSRALAERLGRADGTYLTVVPAPTVRPFSPDAERLVKAVREHPEPFRTVGVAGQSASYVDAKHALQSRLPLALALVAGITFLVLLLAFGSVLVPLKALALNVLSLSATFGAMVWVFQDGHGAGLLGFTPREAVDLFNPVLMLAIAFGVSMDYEVFLLSRVKEEHDRTRDNRSAVALGLERTGRLFTSAALLLAAVFLAFVTSGVSIVKMFGLGLALAVVVDALVVRALLVPSLMAIAGRWNWWAPQRVQRVHERWGFHDRWSAS